MHQIPSTQRTACALACLLTAMLFLAPPAVAAGGHFAVDDAAISEPGQCQLEVWRERRAGGGQPLLHLGPACRTGPLELALNFDRVSEDAGERRALGPQLKWATDVAPQWSVGLVAAAGWVQAGSSRARFGGSSLLIPVSVQVAQPWMVHFNVGRDFHPGTPDRNRSGMAVEWTPQEAWTAIAERFRGDGVDAWRMGGRWTMTPAASVDLSRARALGAHQAGWWTIGLNLTFDR